MNDLSVVILAIAAVSGWIFFAAVLWVDRVKSILTNKLIETNDQAHKSGQRVDQLQEERHRNEQAAIQLLSNQLNQVKVINHTLATELQRRRADPPDEGDWWKNGGKPPGRN